MKIEGILKSSEMKLKKILGSRRRHVRLVLWGCLLLGACYAAPPAGAEPSPSIQFLMREPVSMMDWGLRNIEDHLYRQRNLLVQTDKQLFESEPVLAVSYEWEQNKIQVAITLRAASRGQKTSQGLNAIRTQLEWIIKYLRGSLTMKPYGAFFRHRGFRNQDSPQSLGAELAGQTELVIRVRDADANILSQCKGSLVGSEIVWLSIGTH